MRRLRRTAFLLALLPACGGSDAPLADAGEGVDPWAAARGRMAAVVEERGVRDHGVLAAIGKVPRHAFVPEEARPLAYEDRAVDIGWKQTTSQPWIVAMLAELAEIGPDARVLEIGTGSGYGAAVLAELAGEVYTIEILEPLAAVARDTLAGLGYDNVHVRHGDGYAGWPEAAPFDAIVVTAAPPSTVRSPACASPP